ncbi:MAG: hypothetical protein KA354_19725 [Phycisphaerae bacterium]|nr:hypothetical protein [Phycisphaerae bacterium]
MIMIRFDDDELRSLTHDLVRSFIERHYPEEVAYFPLIWQRFVKERVLDPGSGPVDNQERFAHRLGLPFAEDRGIDLAGALAVVAIGAVLHQLNRQGIAPDLSKIRMAIQCSSVELGAGDQLANELAQELGPQLHNAFQRLNEKTDSVYVERLESGMERPQGAQCSREEAARLCAGGHHDIIIDETVHKLWITGRQEMEILQVPGMQRSMLWLVLTHVGDYIKLEEIESLRRPRKDEEPLLDRSYYAYKDHLGRLLGLELRNRVIGDARERRYPVRTRAFSFCWIRAQSDPKSSELLQGLGTPAGH